jgi:hypothetical protein
MNSRSREQRFEPALKFPFAFADTNLRDRCLSCSNDIRSSELRCDPDMHMQNQKKPSRPNATRMDTFSIHSLLCASGCVRGLGFFTTSVRGFDEKSLDCTYILSYK